MARASHTAPATGATARSFVLDIVACAVGTVIGSVLLAKLDNAGRVIKDSGGGSK